MSGVQAGQCLAADAQAAKPVVIQVWTTSRLGVLSKRSASADGRLSFIGGNIRCGLAAVKPAVNRSSNLRTGRRSSDGGSSPPERKRCELFIIPCRWLQVRYRGAGWGKKKTQQLRVEGHELKLGLFYRHEAAARTEAGRGILSDKVGVSWQDPAMGLGQRLPWEAQREGLGRAQNVRFLGDGAEWVWNLKKDRWPNALVLLDFYHGSQPLWNLGRVLRGETQLALSRGVKPLRHKLRRDQEQKVLRQITRLRRHPGEAGEIIRREQNYFCLVSRICG